jgi:hypothetical protein
MAKFLSGRQKNLKLGVESFSEDKVSLEIIGKVGINSSSPVGTLDVVGDVNVLGSLGISTLTVDNIALGVGASITIAGIAGSDGQYLGSTGTGITWANFPNLRTGFSTVGILSQTNIQTLYNTNFLDIFVNGVLLDSSEYTALNGIDIIFDEPFLGGENIDIFSYNTVSTYSGGGGGTTVVVGGGGESLWTSNVSGIYTNANVGIFTNSPQSTLDVRGNVKISGVVTASNFVGDGSGLSNIIGTGSGIVVLDSGNLVGTASTIDFGNNISVTPISAGILTVSSPDIPPSYWSSGSSGISTASNVGIGTTILSSTLTVNGTAFVSGVSTFQNNINVKGTSTFENNIYLKDDDIIYFGDGNDFSLLHNVTLGGLFQANSNYIYSQNSRDLYISGNLNSSVRIQESGTSANSARFQYGGPVELYYNGVKKIETTNSGIVVSGATTSTSFSGSGTNLTGIVTSIIAGTNVTISGSTGQVTINASGAGGGGESYWTQYSTGISTTSNVGIGTTNATSKLTVAGDGYFTGIITANQFTTQTGGTPTIDSPNNLNINANTVAISTNVTIGNNLTVSGDAIVGVNTSKGLILTSPNGTQYRLIVSNSGVLSTTAVV